jgi:diguanylate cyclase (GGDEF)-like protein
VQNNNPFLRLLCISLLLIGLASQECLAERKKRILVLHSYHQGLEWTDNITQGIQSVMSPFHEHYEIHYEYLDTKRNSGADYMRQLVNFISTKNAPIHYEVVIVADNTALKLLNDGSIRFSGEPPVVFCGINNYQKELTAGIAEVTGVVEKTDHRATVELIRKLHPQRNHITVVLDKTPTGDVIREQLKDIERAYGDELKFEFLREFLLQEVREKVAGLGEKDAIYILTFNRDKNDNFISYAEGIEMLARNSQVPIYGSWDFYLGKGIVGGRITSGYRQGQEAAQLALKILHGQQASRLKVVTGPTQYMFDYKYMNRYGVDRSMLPGDSLIINLPPSVYERFRLLLVSISIASICVALFFLWKYKRQQSMLAAKQTLALELEKKVDERTRELRIANRELQRLSNLDGLTQLYNRRYFDDNLYLEINRLQRSATPISLLLCDIDYFKNYNDKYGHLAGDDCIRTVADIILRYCKRLTDIAARYGGEEFGVILPNTPSDEALKIAESIRHEIELTKTSHETSPISDFVTISIGVATIIPHIHTTPSSLISLADKALYESKNGGRNRVVLNQE